MEEIFEGLEVVEYIVVVLALAMNIYVVRKFGQGMLNIVFISLGFSIFFLGSYFVFHGLTEGSGWYALSDGTKHVWAHSLVYLSMISIIWGGYRVKAMAASTDIDDVSGFGMRDRRFYSFLALIMVLIFILSPGLEGGMVDTAAMTTIDSWGLHHFTVFVLGAIAAWYLLFIKGNWGLLSSSITMLMWFVFLIGLQHLWESVTESWMLYTPTEVVIESVEGVIVTFAVLVLCVAQWKIIKFVKG